MCGLDSRPRHPLLSAHVSHWNFTEPWLRMRYDVFQYSLVDNSYTESHHLFLYDQKTRYTWFNKSDGACAVAVGSNSM